MNYSDKCSRYVKFDIELFNQKHGGDKEKILKFIKRFMVAMRGANDNEILNSVHHHFM